jgi:hypothetical protein
MDITTAAAVSHAAIACTPTVPAAGHTATLRAALLGGASVLALAGVILPRAAVALDRTISTSVTGPVAANGGAITITPSGTIASARAGITFGTITTLNNQGVINGSAFGISGNGTIGTLTNSGQINGTVDGAGGLSNSGAIGTLSNSGTIYAESFGTGLVNSGGIGVLSNSGAIRGRSAVFNSGKIGSLTNNGAIIGGTSGFGMVNYGGSIGELTNTGTISGISGAMVNSGTIGTLSNSGTIVTYGDAIDNESRSIGTLINSGRISSDNVALWNNGGTIGTLSNSGTIIGGGSAINSSGGHLGGITNSGVINGNINIGNQNISIGNQDVTISGGSGAVFGTLNGGSLNVAYGNLLFAGGNTHLGDSIIVDGGAGSVTNAGVLQVAESHAITGSFIQTAAGALDIQAASATAFSNLAISGAANLGGSLAFDLVSGFTLASGEDFGILTFASKTGDFSAFSFDGVACTAGGADAWTCGSWTFAEVFTATSLSLDVTAAGGGSVPEPATMGLFASGLTALGLVRRRRRA